MEERFSEVRGLGLPRAAQVLLYQPGVLFRVAFAFSCAMAIILFLPSLGGP